MLNSVGLQITEIGFIVFKGIFLNFASSLIILEYSDGLTTSYNWSEHHLGHVNLLQLE